MEILEIKSSGPIPFKVKIDGSSAILIPDVESISIKFEKFQKSFDVKYSEIRCIQKLKGSTILIDVTADNNSKKYLISAQGAKKLYSEIHRKLQ